MLLAVCAALFMTLAPVEVGAQVFFFYKDWPEMTLDNENVELITYIENDGRFYEACMNVRIRNKSDRTIYIDLGNTFLTVNDESRCYYTPSSTSVTEGKSSGVGVNLGLVNVGGGTSSAQTTTTFTQRVIALPPMSAKNLELKQLIVAPVPEMAIFCDIFENFISPRCQLDATQYPRVPEGQTWTFGPDDNTLRFSVMVACSFDESCAEPFTLRHGYYVDRTACYKNRLGLKCWDAKIPCMLSEYGLKVLAEFFPEWDSWGDFFLLSATKSRANSVLK